MNTLLYLSIALVVVLNHLCTSNSETIDAGIKKGYKLRTEAKGKADAITLLITLLQLFKRHSLCY